MDGKILNSCYQKKIPHYVQVIQRRGDFGEPRENFDRNWVDYKRGFGDLEKEFWIGNDKIHELTKSGNMKLRVELEAHDGRTAWAEYENFRYLIVTRI